MYLPHRLEILMNSRGVIHLKIDFMNRSQMQPENSDQKKKKKGGSWSAEMFTKAREVDS
jgi:hypothetical protein